MRPLNKPLIDSLEKLLIIYFLIIVIIALALLAIAQPDPQAKSSFSTGMEAK